MQKENVSQFISNKIEELQSALFFPEISDRILPAYVIQRVQTDEQGNIEFIIPCPSNTKDYSNESFPCRMDFYRKGVDFHLKINGIATMCQETGAGNKKQLAIKVQIQQANYFEIPPAQPAVKTKSNFLDIVNKWSALLLHKTFNSNVELYN